MATREKYDLGKIGDAILTGLEKLAQTPVAKKPRVGSKRAVLTQDRVRDRIREMLDQGYAPSDIAEACKAAGMPILGKTIMQYCRTPEGEPIRRPASRGKRSRRKPSASKAAIGTTTRAAAGTDAESIADRSTFPILPDHENL